MPWFSEIEAESRIIPRKRQVRRQTAQIIEPEASIHNTIGVTVPAYVCKSLGSDLVLLSVAKRHKRFHGCPQTFCLFRPRYSCLSPFLSRRGAAGPAE
jgi:hypothetical protein